MLGELTENRRTTNRQTENSKPEATLIPLDRRGERANYKFWALYSHPSSTYRGLVDTCGPQCPKHPSSGPLPASSLAECANQTYSI